MPKRVAYQPPFVVDFESLPVLQALADLAAEPCERYHDGRYTCATDSPWRPGNYYGTAPDARRLANRYCPPCRLRAALAGRNVKPADR